MLDARYASTAGGIAGALDCAGDGKDVRGGSELGPANAGDDVRGRGDADEERMSCGSMVDGGSSLSKSSMVSRKGHL